MDLSEGTAMLSVHSSGTNVLISTFIYFERQRGQMERETAPFYQALLQQVGLDQAETRSQQLKSGLAHEWQGPRDLTITTEALAGSHDQGAGCGNGAGTQTQTLY